MIKSSLSHRVRISKFLLGYLGTLQMIETPPSPGPVGGTPSSQENVAAKACCIFSQLVERIQYLQNRSDI